MVLLSSSHDSVDLLVVGAGMIGLAHAAAAVERGLRVAVVERDERAVGASVRNFGHICATAQGGEALPLAREARELWLGLADAAGLDLLRCGTVVVARADDELGVLEEFAAERGSDEVRLLTADQVREQAGLGGQDVVGGAHLPLDLRANTPDAVPAVAAWLASRGVEFCLGTQVGSVEPGLARTSRGPIAAERIVVTVNHDLDRLFPDIAEKWQVRRCELQMLQIDAGGLDVQPAVLTGLSMLRYAGLAAQPSSAAVRSRFEADAPELLGVDMNLMLTRRPDGALILGDTHHYAVTHDPIAGFADTELLLREGARLLGIEPRVQRAWRGVYASSPLTDWIVEEPLPGVHAVSVTTGIGMTIGLALGRRCVDQLLG